MPVPHLLSVAAARQERHHPLAALPFSHLRTQLRRVGAVSARVIPACSVLQHVGESQNSCTAGDRCCSLTVRWIPSASAAALCSRTSVIIPQHSRPSSFDAPGGAGYVPCLWNASARLMAAVRVLMRTSFGFRSGFGSFCARGQSVASLQGAGD